MRSWSSSDGIMLVPSTFTGWYRKTMMNAEMAREITRSRNQTASTGVLRWTGFPGAEAFRNVLEGPGDDIPSRLYYGTVRLRGKYPRPFGFLHGIHRSIQSDLHSRISGRDARKRNRRVQYRDRGYVPYVEACIHFDVPVRGNSDGFGSVGRQPGGPGSAGLQFRAASERKETTADPPQGKLVGRERAVSVSDARL